LKKALFLITLFTALLTTAYGQTKQVQPKGIYKEIEVAKHNKTIEHLHGKNKNLKQQAVSSILQSPNDYNPPVLYALSRELFLQDKKEEASFWFYVAQLRARYDANRCADRSATQAVSILNGEYGPDINKYAFANHDFLKSTVEKVVEFVKTNEENYDHRWLNLHGMGVFLNEEGEALSKPQEEWPAIKLKTVDDYYSSFLDYLAKQKEQ
jgi:hypothetical protein